MFVVTFANSDLTSYQLGFPIGGDWYEVLNGDAAAYGGRNHGNAGKIAADGGPLHGFGQSASILIPRMGVLLFARKPLTPEPQPGFVRGNCNGDGTVDISDAIQTLGILFLGTSAGNCLAACDANSDDRVDISDGIFTLTFLFGGGAAPSAPWPACGRNPGALACEALCGG